MDISRSRRRPRSPRSDALVLDAARASRATPRARKPRSTPPTLGRDSRDRGRSAAPTPALTLARTHARVGSTRCTTSARPPQQELDEAIAALAEAEPARQRAKARSRAAHVRARRRASGGRAPRTSTVTYATLTAPFDGLVTDARRPRHDGRARQSARHVEDPAIAAARGRSRRSRASPGEDRDSRSRSVWTRTRQTSPWVDGARRRDRAYRPRGPRLRREDRPPCRPAWRSGLFGRARIRGAPRVRRSPCPQPPLIRRGQLTFVFVVDDRRTRELRAVSAGETSGDRIELLAGVTCRRGCGRQSAGRLARRRAGHNAGRRPMTRPHDGSGRPPRRRVHPLEADAAAHRRVAAARRLRRRRAAARGRAADHRADDRRVRRDAGRVADRGRAARHAAAREAALGSARRRVPLLHLEPGPGDGRRPLPRRPGRRARARAAQPEARRECDLRCRPARRRRSCKPRSIDDVPVMALTLWGARLRRRAAAADGGAAAATRSKEVPDVSEVTIIGGRPRAGHRRARSGARSPRAASIRSRVAAGARGARTSAQSGGARRRGQPVDAASKRAPGRRSVDGVARRRRRRDAAARRSASATSRRSPTAAASRTTT